jgi:hypothetical protein
MTTVQQPEIQLIHSLKLEATANRLRISVHFYAIDSEKAIDEAFNAYLNVNSNG